MKLLRTGMQNYQVDCDEHTNGNCTIYICLFRRTVEICAQNYVQW